MSQAEFSIPTAAIVGVLAIVGLVVFFWRRSGIGSGRRLGNRVASHLGIQRSLFYALLAHGAKGSSRDLLASLEKLNLSLEKACVALGPSLSRGIDRMEAHFGSQEAVDAVKPIVKRLVAESEQRP